MFWIISGLVLAGMVVFYATHARRRPGVVARATVDKAPPATKIWGRRLVATEPHACPAARALAGQSFRLDQAPTLPLQGCNNPDCRCVFQPQTDRRSGEERRQGIERRDMARFDAPTDRRSGKGRRKDDSYTWHTTI